MRNDVHSAALRAAAKVAFSVAFLGGCAAPLASDTAAGDPADGLPTDDGPVATEADLTAKKPRKPTIKPPPVACHDAGAPQSCEAVVAAAFPTEGRYPGTKQSVAAAVQTCCVELLTASLGQLANHRWDCCANLPAGENDEKVGIACTPWGPPVPPAMKRRATRAPAQALAEVA